MAFVNPAEVIHTLGIKEGSKFADFGAGTGAFVLSAAPLVGVTGRVYAIDIQKDILLKLKDTAIKAGITNTKFLWCDFEVLGATKLPDDSLDVVLISNTLFQLEDRAGALREAYRVLKPDGSLYIIDWSDSFNGMGPSKELIVTQTEAQTLAESAGFKLKDTFTPGDHHYGLHFNK